MSDSYSSIGDIGDPDAHGYSRKFGFPGEQVQWTPDLLDDLLHHGAAVGASDIHLATGEPAIVTIEGLNHQITRKVLSSSDMIFLTNRFYNGSDGDAFIKQGNDFDCSYEVSDHARTARKHFRVNVTPCRGVGGETAVSITLRVVNSKPRSFDELGIEPEIRAGFECENGLILVVGKTNSGKSTLLAAAILEKLNARVFKRKILTYEAPIETVFDSVKRFRDMIYQHEIPRHIKTFLLGVRNSLRRAPSDVLIGEARDLDTISAAMEVSETGHLCMTTVHARSVPESISRVINFFPLEQHSARLGELVEALRMIVVQRLVPGLDGKRVGLREYLIFDDIVRDKLRQATTLHEVEAMLTLLVEERGRSLTDAAMLAYQEKRIGANVLASVEATQRKSSAANYQTTFAE